MLIFRLENSVRLPTNSHLRSRPKNVAEVGGPSNVHLWKGDCYENSYCVDCRPHPFKYRCSRRRRDRCSCWRDRSRCGRPRSRSPLSAPLSSPAHSPPPLNIMEHLNGCSSLIESEKRRHDSTCRRFGYDQAALRCSADPAMLLRPGGNGSAAACIARRRRYNCHGAFARKCGPEIPLSGNANSVTGRPGAAICVRFRERQAH